MDTPTTLCLPPLSLYIHIPWCVQKCPYCDFNSHESQQIDEAAYIKVLQKDLLTEKQWLTTHNDTRKLHSIFFGGGTPSLFSANSIATILTFAEKTIGFEDNIEITLEANPGTFEQQKFYDFFHVGINRLSIGIQSFHPSHLKKLGRIHNSDEAKHAVNIAKQASFERINLDLMHGLPEQNLEQAMNDIETAIALEPQHISWYQLTIEPNTAFYRQPPPLPCDDILADIQHQGTHRLQQQGFEHYEISAFSQAGGQARHNINYWQFGDYLGIGAGAHGKLTHLQTQTIIRRQKTRHPEHYLKYTDAPNHKEHTVEESELCLEFMMNALRLHTGTPSHYFTERTGLPLAAIEPALAKLKQQGLLIAADDTIATTELGQRFLNTVLETFSH